jgi:ribokinase
MISSHDRNASIFTYRGANTLISAEDVPAESFEGADLVHVAGLSNKSADQFAHIVGSARRAGAFVSANPGIRQLTSRREAFLACLGDIDLLSINRVEAEALMPALAARAGDTVDAPLPEDPPPLMRRGLDGSGFVMSLEGFCAALHDAGLRYATVTDGTDGAYLSMDKALYFCPPLQVKPAGTAGAGDSFTATLVSKLLLGEPPDMALAAASVNAASVVGYIDTQTGLLGPEALENMLNSAPDDFKPRRLL